MNIPRFDWIKSAQKICREHLIQKKNRNEQDHEEKIEP